MAYINMYEVVHHRVRGHLLLCMGSYIIRYEGIYCYVRGRTSFGTRTTIVMYEVVHGYVRGQLLLCTRSYMVVYVGIYCYVRGSTWLCAWATIVMYGVLPGYNLTRFFYYFYSRWYIAAAKEAE